jgi:hypothetical protein
MCYFISDITFFNTSPYLPIRVSPQVTKNSEVLTLLLSFSPLFFTIIAAISHAHATNKFKASFASTHTTPDTSFSSKSKSSKFHLYSFTYTLAFALS